VRYDVIFLLAKCQNRISFEGRSAAKLLRNGKLCMGVKKIFNAISAQALYGKSI